MADIRDILDIERPTGPEVTKEAILGPEKKAKRLIFNGTKASKRPEGMAREVFALLYNDKKDAPPVFPTDTGQGYKSNKAKLGMKSVRPWKWTPFSNPARKDNAMFFHWRRVCDEGKDYPFAKFNKVVPIPTYTEAEYQSHLVAEGWTKPETDHLFDLCRRFDLRFVIIQDRYDYVQFKKRSIEELKERYYSVVSALAKVKTGPGLTAEAKIYSFDAEHERKRKEQLHRLYLRTSEQVEEEQMLQNELKKIEARKKERDKKTQDLQKLITAADHQQEPRKNDKKFSRKKIQTASSRPKIDQLVRQSTELSSIKFPDLKGSGVTVRSQRMKLPANIGQKKMKAIEAMLQELQTETNPMPTEENCTHFNELRSDLLLLYELKTAMANCEFELQALRHQYEAANPGKTLTLPKILQPDPPPVKADESGSGNGQVKNEIIDVVGSPTAMTG
ncbi:DNA methyltransferase 1-associated [Nesidiocoris tenuis]|uniref:DNA methyltransferase 1-associated n=1 Tax=Nesidiocoris tenuis TaxID=355587 RepID=A0ABN7BFR4_9HEMI|nr:DNA methyltransferase 1-associated [Nesidiocoris tenuis]